MFSQKPSMRRRVLKAAGILAVNLFLWVVLPYYLGSFLAGIAPTSPITIPGFIYEFGFVITALQVSAALTQGTFPWVPFTMATYIVEALYLWLATDGGEIGVNFSGNTLSLEFRLILLILIIPPLWGAVRAPLSYLAYRSSLTPKLPSTGPMPTSA